jgi:hypothetical protein
MGAKRKRRKEVNPSGKVQNVDASSRACFDLSPAAYAIGESSYPFG